MDYTEDVLLAPDTEVVCWCANVTKGQILEVQKTGASTLEDIKKATGACTKGNCRKNNPRGRCCSAEILRLLSANSATRIACGCCSMS